MKKRQSGYSLLELMVVVVLIGIVTAVAAPQLSEGVANTSVSDATNEVIVAFRFARAQAARFGRAMGVFVDADGSDSIVRVDRSTDNACANLPATCNTTDIPTYGGANCGLKVVRFDRGTYPRHRVKILGIRGTTDPALLCVTPIGRVMEQTAGTWSRTLTQIEIGIHRTAPDGTSVGVVRSVTIGNLGLPRSSLSKTAVFTGGP